MTNRLRARAEALLFTDHYQFTMAQVYFRLGLHETPAQFDYFFRTYPDYGSHQAGYCVNAGLESLVDWMRSVRVRRDDLARLRSQKTGTGAPLFGRDFLDWLGSAGAFGTLSLRAIPEGRVVHANEPLAIVRGPLAMAQLLETALLNHLNYQTLVATKAARIRQSGRGQPMLEFGLRRAQDRAALAGARAALIGGADYSSNVGASQLLGFPPKGTHAHSMVQVFMALGGDERSAFRAYAETYPDDCILLVDTLDTLGSGLPNAIRTFEELRRKGHEPVGIRLDSGDLAYLSVQAARLLDEAGFPNCRIVLSNQLDELVILQIVAQIEDEAARYGLDPERVIHRLVYGVGSRLITSYGAPALDGVYKLVALRKGRAWAPAFKISETPAKTINPGNKRVWRLYDARGKATADLLCLEDEDPLAATQLTLHHPLDGAPHRMIPRAALSAIEPLLVEVLREGTPVCEFPPIEQLRERRRLDLERLDSGVRRLIRPHVYHVSLSPRLWELKARLLASAKVRIATTRRRS